MVKMGFDSNREMIDFPINSAETIYKINFKQIRGLTD